MLDAARVGNAKRNFAISYLTTLLYRVSRRAHLTNCISNKIEDILYVVYE